MKDGPARSSLTPRSKSSTTSGLSQVATKGVDDLAEPREGSRASPYSLCHHFILGTVEMALSSIITSSSCLIW
jgi:hypothetical protein